VDDSYKPLLKSVGSWEAPDGSAIVIALAVLLAVPLVLFIISALRRRSGRKEGLARGYEQLSQVGDEKGLTYPEQMTAERMAGAARLANASHVLTSVDAFDQAAAVWMPRAEQLPWREMEAQVEQLASMRRKLGFRLTPPDRRPRNTRHLVLGHRLHVLSPARKGVGLLSAAVVDLDDLAIRTDAFRVGDRTVRLRHGLPIWVFFWSGTGEEFRFSSEVLKEVQRPQPFLMLRHGDRLSHAKKTDFLSCALRGETACDWLPSGQIPGTSRSARLFDKVPDYETEPVQFARLSGSGFLLTSEAPFGIDDVVRIQPDSAPLPALSNLAGKVISVGPRGVRVRFLEIADDDREAVLREVTRRMSAKALRKLNPKPGSGAR